ncbi:hypothetical protein B9Z55_009203 [Caenorhabditis nigoni]|uniref:DUF7809 domain-containing protein n=1 Tax=Caenorhabditis nigoni TaxID=1611254 RepID=A0A2G5UR34_9PELO|nr:hypothetical protein B9Z55_009203 [Caenorhabditis nigoni]
MSELEHPHSSVLTKSALSRAVARYIPKELHKYAKLPFDGSNKVESNGKEELEWMLTNSDNMLRMYGSGEELAENLEIYMGLSSDRWMGYDVIETYYPVAIEYASVSEETFTQKSHMFLVLYHFLYFNVGALKYSEIYYAILSILLKSINARNDESLEFVKTVGIDKIREKVKNEFFENQIFSKQQHCIPNFKECSVMRKSDAFLEIIKEFKKLIPVWNDEYRQLETLIQKLLEEHYSDNTEELEAVFSISQFMVTYVEGIISSYPELFLPYDRVKNPNHPIAVRIFQDNELFVMKSELFNAINLLDPNSRKYEDDNGKILTLNLKSISMEFRNQIRKIDLLFAPIKRTKHAVVPIPTLSGDHCIPAVDALLEILNRLIFCHRIFQKFQEITWPILSAHLAPLLEFFSAHEVVYLLYSAPGHFESGHSESLVIQANG